MIKSMIGCQCCNDINQLLFGLGQIHQFKIQVFLAIVRVTNRYHRYMNHCCTANYNELLQTFSGAVKTICSCSTKERWPNEFFSTCYRSTRTHKYKYFLWFFFKFWKKNLKFTAMQIEKISFVNKNEKRDNMTRHFWIQYKRQSNPNKIYVST